jgi:hypothetical protein
MACASATNAPNARYTPASTRDILTASEIVASRVTDVYQAVIQLRPQFLRRRNTQPMPVAAFPATFVYLDDLPYGGVESLHQIPIERVRVIRYISSITANVRFGGSHPQGAILVTTMRERVR